MSANGVGPDTPVPLDVLHISDASQAAGAAVRFRDSFIRIPKSRPGAVQSDELRDAAKSAFQKHRPGKPVEIANIRDGNWLLSTPPTLGGVTSSPRRSMN